MPVATVTEICCDVQLQLVELEVQLQLEVSTGSEVQLDHEIQLGDRDPLARPHIRLGGVYY